MQFRAEGVIAAMVTPMARGGVAVDLGRTRAVAQFLAEDGVHGLFVCGTTGEGPLLTVAERHAVLETVIDAVGERLTVIAQTGALNTAETIALTRHARDAGAHAAAVVTPSYFGYDDRALVVYFGSVAKAVPDFPVLLYNIPGCTGNALSVALVLQLADRHENIVGIKDSSGNMADMTRLIAEAPERFFVISGSDLSMFAALASGAHAVVSGPANVAAPVCRAIYDNVRKGRLDAAWEAQETLARVVAGLDYGGKIAGYKEGLRLRGIDVGAVRPPQREFTAAEKRVLSEGLRSVGLVR